MTFTLAQYKKNEDKNDHSFNAFCIAKEFGTAEELEIITEILDRHDENGHIEYVDQNKRDEISKKYLNKLN